MREINIEKEVSMPESATPPVSDAVRWIARAAELVRQGKRPEQSLALLEIFGGAPRPWSMTSATNRRIARLGHSEHWLALSLDAGFEPSENVFEPGLARDIETILDAQLVELLWIAIPCESLSIMWTEHGPHPFRSRGQPDMLEDIPPQ